MLHVIIPIQDMLWSSQQKPSVNQLWQECWTADLSLCFSVDAPDKCFKEAIANQIQGQVEQGNPATLGDATRTLLVENSVSGVEIKTVDECEGSAASVPNPEKWSHKAVVAWSNA